MIIVKITGGLGNQLFQYAFGRYLSNRHRSEVLYEIDTKKKLKNFTPRKLELLNFNIALPQATESDIKHFKVVGSGIFSRMERKLTQLIPRLNKRYFVEKSMHQILPGNFLTDNCYYDGYWQCLEYVNGCKELLKIQMSLNNKIINTELIENIITFNSVSIHIRRGDYITVKNNRKIYQRCELEYYNKAISYINEKCKNPVFYIFSDDIDWAKKNLIAENIVYITKNEPAHDMYLMSLCKHHIIANSTFSWWGAFLNTFENKIVIAPKKWYVSELNNKLTNFIPVNWIRL